MYNFIIDPSIVINRQECGSNRAGCGTTKPLVELNRQAGTTLALLTNNNLKAPIPKIRVVGREENKIFKTPQKQIMSPVHKIAKPSHLFTPMAKKTNINNLKIAKSLFLKSPITKSRK